MSLRIIILFLLSLNYFLRAITWWKENLITEYYLFKTKEDVEKLKFFLLELSITTYNVYTYV